MRTHFLVALLCISTSTMFAANTVKLHGKITNPISDSILVRYSETWVGYEPKVVATRLSADGSFSLSFPLEHKYTQVLIQHGDQETEIFPEPGNDLGMTLDAKNFDSSLHYTGKGAEVANFLALHMITIGSSLTFGGQLQELCIEDPAAFEEKANVALNKEIDFLKANDKVLPASFKKMWKANYQYNLYYIMLSYPTFHEMQKQHSYTISSIPKEDYKTVLDVPAAFDDELLTVSAYRMYLNAYYYQLITAKNAMAGSDVKATDSAQDIEAYRNMPKGSAEIYGAGHICNKLKYYTYTEGQARVLAYKKQFPASPYLSLLDEKMALKKKFSAGSKAVDFTFTTLDGKAMKLSDLKGKVVYLDFWASWCGPCKGEMPFAKKVEEKYKDKDVVFLYVSIDADDAAWKSAMQKMQIDGVNTRDDGGGWDGAIAKQYDIRSIPAYFLIDKEGNYAVDNAPRPSSTGDLTNTIDKLLR